MIKDDKIRTSVKFLMHIYNDSIVNIATLMNAEAEDDLCTIKKYLIGIRDYADEMIKYIDNNGKL